MDSDNAKNVGTSNDLQFKNFEVVAEAKDHHYLQHNKNQQQCFSDCNASLYGNIMKEWRILKENLPESIYVQVYETRIDLLRAVIIGPAGTPYHDGLFFFDIVLPCDYPKSPPKVHYHSHGYRLNPNLYEDGFVCLSLINTWEGSIDETWSEKSTLLQLFVSIQGLVLNERPFFNEPGFSHDEEEISEEPPWINDSSIDYNEDAFILSCKTMLQIIKQPPINFEDFVVEYFRRRGDAILAAIEHYQTGHVEAGQYFDEMMMNAAAASSSSSLEASRISSKFKANLEDIQPKLSDAFASVRISDEPNYKDNASAPKQVKKRRSSMGKYLKKLWKTFRKRVASQ